MLYAKRLTNRRHFTGYLFCSENLTSFHKSSLFYTSYVLFRTSVKCFTNLHNFARWLLFCSENLKIVQQIFTSLYDFCSVPNTCKVFHKSSPYSHFFCSVQNIRKHFTNRNLFTWVVFFSEQLLILLHVI